MRYRDFFAPGLAAGLTFGILTGCNHPAEPHGPHANPSISSPRHYLTTREAARLAAQLANDECHRLYGKRPFIETQSQARLEGSRYRWGGLDVAADSGYSALVEFDPDGRHPKTEVYYSTDAIPRGIASRPTPKESPPAPLDAIPKP